MTWRFSPLQLVSKTLSQFPSTDDREAGVRRGGPADAWPSGGQGSGRRPGSPGAGRSVTSGATPGRPALRLAPTGTGRARAAATTRRDARRQPRQPPAVPAVVQHHDGHADRPGWYARWVPIWVEAIVQITNSLAEAFWGFRWEDSTALSSYGDSGWQQGW